FRHVTSSLLASPSLFCNHPAPTATYTLSLHDALPISRLRFGRRLRTRPRAVGVARLRGVLVVPARRARTPVGRDRFRAVFLLVRVRAGALAALAPCARVRRDCTRRCRGLRDARARARTALD